MPYVSPAARSTLEKITKAIEEKPPLNAGELQYLIAVMIKSMDTSRYQNMNDIMGALAGAQMEFYRRTVVPYEDKKIEENGDV